MKSKLIIVITLSISSFFAVAQGGIWLRKADFGGVQRQGAVSFSIGSKGYILTGQNSINFSDFWEYDTATDTWTQKASFPGSARCSAVAFTIGNKGYIGTGYDSDSIRSDFWEWDQATDIWIQKASLPAYPRYAASGFSIGNKGYIGLGIKNWGGGVLDDFWEWDQATNLWIQKANFGGSSRQLSYGNAIEDKGYFVSGVTSSAGCQDFWEWNSITNIWTQKADFPGGIRYEGTGFVIGLDFYYGTGQAGPSATNCQLDFWKYNTLTNVWTQKSNFGGAVRELAVGFSIAGKGYIGTGFKNDGPPYYKDFWEYTPDTINTIGINDRNKNLSISVSPNPFIFETTIKLNVLLKNATLTIYTSTGNIVGLIKNISSPVISIKRENLHSGIYFFQITENNNIITNGKLIILDY